MENNFALSGIEDKGDRGDIADLPLFRTLSAICRKSQEPQEEFFALLTYVNLAASRILS